MNGVAFEKTGITQAVILNLFDSAILNSIDSVILNLFQDNMMAQSVILIQVQHDELFVKVI